MSVLQNEWIDLWMDYVAPLAEDTARSSYYLFSYLFYMVTSLMSDESLSI